MTKSNTPDLIYAVGDVHGMADLLETALGEIKSSAGAAAYQIVFLGDYIDRGPASDEVVALVRYRVDTYGDVALKGNHEDLMVRGIAEVERGIIGTAFECWIGNGGDKTTDAYRTLPREVMRGDRDWMDGLPTMHLTPHHVFVHAGLHPQLVPEATPPEHRMWMSGTEDQWEGGPDPDARRHMVYGHTPRLRPRLRPWSTGLDTRAFSGGGSLSVGVFDPAVPGGPRMILRIRDRGVTTWDMTVL